MTADRRAAHFATGLLAGIIAGGVGVTYGPLTWTGAVLFVVLSGALMPRFAFLAGGLVALGGTWLTLMLLLNTPREFLVVPVVLMGSGAVLTYLTASPIRWRSSRKP
jgi:hypothetical protein